MPPTELTRRVGAPYDGSDGERIFDELGRLTRDEIIAMLPDDWSFVGKRALDFGCGAGRVLRHFLVEGEKAEFWGCDIDAPSINWLRANMVPPLQVFVNGEWPPIPQGDGSFDLIWAASVFTHLSSSWSAWLLEFHRVLAPGGVLLASFIGERTAISEAQDWEEDRIGMNVLDGGLDYSEGGPIVLHSEWWIRAHWSRAFEIERLDAPDGRQGWVLMRKRSVSLNVGDLEAVAPDEPREVDALRHNIEQVERRVRALVLENRELASQMSELVESRSWRLTRPLRAARPRLER